MLSRALLLYLCLALVSSTALALHRPSFVFTIKTARQRLRTLDVLARKQNQNSSFDIANRAFVYTAQVDVGEGTYTLYVDTTTADTWIGEHKHYVPGKHSVSTNKTMSVSSGSLTMQGSEFLDDLTLGQIMIQSQPFGVATKSSGVGATDGILAFGPEGLSENTVSGGGKVSSLLTSMQKQGLIKDKFVGFAFQPPTLDTNISNPDAHDGEIDFGGPNTENFLKGSLKFVNVTKKSPASQYLSFDVDITAVSSTHTPVFDGPCMLSSAGGFYFFTSEAFQTYKQVTKANVDKATGLLVVKDATNIPDLEFNIGGTTYTLIADAQVVPKFMIPNPAADTIYLGVVDLGPPTTGKFDCVLGTPFFDRFYIGYKPDVNQVAIGKTKFTTVKFN